MSAAPHMLFQEDDREIERQAALDRYAIVDTAPEQAFDELDRIRHESRPTPPIDEP